MKKHLIVAAVAAAVAVPAMAQVTVSGRIDTSYQSFDAGEESSTRVNGSLLTTNQIVFSGSEDLGGGLKAGFVISSGFLSDDNGNLDFGSRGAAVTIGGGFGTIEIGKTPGTMLNNITTSGLTGNLGNLLTLEARPDNGIGYTSPSMGGFTARILQGVGTETPGAAKGDGKQTEMSLAYSGGPLTVRVAQAKFSTFVVPVVAGGGVTGVVALAASAADDVTQTGADLSYTIGAVRLNARYSKVELDTEAQNDVRGQTAMGFGASYGLGGGLTVAGDYVYTNNEAADDDSTRMSLTLVKGLSKRTNVYGAFYMDTFEEDGRESASIMAIGVRHSF
jgi:predicted porin